PSQTFKNLFMPEPRVQEDSSSEGPGTEIEDLPMAGKWNRRKIMGMAAMQSMVLGSSRLSADIQLSSSMFSLPTDAEMKGLSKAFAIHPTILRCSKLGEVGVVQELLFGFL
ncbi:hypothetical protein RUND412_011424, partial [Rhizina undulata]